MVRVGRHQGPSFGSFGFRDIISVSSWRSALLGAESVDRDGVLVVGGLVQG